MHKQYIYWEINRLAISLLALMIIADFGAKIGISLFESKSIYRYLGNAIFLSYILSSPFVINKFLDYFVQNKKLLLAVIISIFTASLLVIYNFSVLFVSDLARILTIIFTINCNLIFFFLAINYREYIFSDRRKVSKINIRYELSFEDIARLFLVKSRYKIIEIFDQEITLISNYFVPYNLMKIKLSPNNTQIAFDDSAYDGQHIVDLLLSHHSIAKTEMQIQYK